MCNEISIRGKHDQSQKGETGGTGGGKGREGVYSRGSGGKQQGAGQGETKTVL